MTDTLGGLHRHLREALDASGNAESSLDARLILERATGAGRLDLLTQPERPVSPEEADAAMAMLGRRVAGEPVHRILGFREFYGLRLEISRGTLEPRPDTEALVDAVLPFARDLASRRGTCNILDLGTGTGAIALALLSQVPAARAVGCDISDDALATARRNADINGVGDRFLAVRSDWFEAMEGTFDLIVSNPPYIASSQIATLAPEVRDHDPRTALDGGADGLDCYRIIASRAGSYLEPSGMIAMEIGHDQKDAVSRLFHDAGFALAEARRDLAGNDRALVFSDPR